jgi:hypothetical protein
MLPYPRNKIQRIARSRYVDFELCDRPRIARISIQHFFERVIDGARRSNAEALNRTSAASRGHVARAEVGVADVRDVGAGAEACDVEVIGARRDGRIVRKLTGGNCERGPADRGDLDLLLIRAGVERQHERQHVGGKRYCTGDRKRRGALRERAVGGRDAQVDRRASCGYDRLKERNCTHLI